MLSEICQTEETVYNITYILTLIYSRNSRMVFTRGWRVEAGENLVTGYKILVISLNTFWGSQIQSGMCVNLVA